MTTTASTVLHLSNHTASSATRDSFSGEQPPAPASDESAIPSDMRLHPQTQSEVTDLAPLEAFTAPLHWPIPPLDLDAAPDGRVAHSVRAAARKLQKAREKRRNNRIEKRPPTQSLAFRFAQRGERRFRHFFVPVCRITNQCPPAEQGISKAGAARPGRRVKARAKNLGRAMEANLDAIVKGGSPGYPFICHS